MTSSGATPPNTKTRAVTGTEARTRTNTQARALSSLPRTIASDEIGVTDRSSSVWCSRSLLIAPAVAAGARTATMSVWRNIRPRKMPRPIEADAYVDCPPNDEIELIVSSFNRSNIQAKTARSRTWIVMMMKARRPRIRPRSSLTMIAEIPEPKRRFGTRPRSESRLAIVLTPGPPRAGRRRDR